MGHKIVISDLDHDSIDIEREVLQKHGLDCDWRSSRTEEDVIANLQDATVLIIQYSQLTRKAIESLPNLKQIIRYGVGVDTIDLEAATEHGIQVCNVPDYGMCEVADHAVALTMCLLRKIYRANEDVRSGVWDFSAVAPIHRFSSMTAGIIGLGRIGKEYAKRLHAFGFKIIACDPYAFDVPNFVTMVPLETIIKVSDLISLHCPQDSNINLISDREFDMMKDGVFIVNVSRGGIVNEDALDRALTSKKVAGAGLDVAMIEPMDPAHPLLKHKDVLISPHMAWYSVEAAKELKRKVAEEAARFVKGDPVHYPVNEI